MQNNSGENVHIWRVIGLVILRIKILANICLILTVYTDTNLWISWTNSVTFLFVGLKESWGFQNKSGYTRRMARSHFGCYCQHNEFWRTKDDIRTRAAKWHWGWRWGSWNIFLNSQKRVTSTSKNPQLNIKFKFKLN